MKSSFAVLAAAILLALPVSAAAETQTPAGQSEGEKAQPITSFFGRFVGQTKVVEGEGANTAAAGRESEVLIEQTADGFKLRWATLFIDEERPADVELKDSTEITFKATKDSSVFEQVGAPPLFSGKAYYWARLSGNTMHVTGLVLTSDGTYDVTHYARTVQGGTMRLEFTRFRNGELVRRVSGNLERQAN